MFLDEIVPLKLYSPSNKIIPINEKNKRNGSAIFLLSNSLDESEKLIRLPYVKSYPYYNSYYLEKDISFVIGENGELIEK